MEVADLRIEPLQDPLVSAPHDAGSIPRDPRLLQPQVEPDGLQQPESILSAPGWLSRCDRLGIELNDPSLERLRAKAVHVAAELRHPMIGMLASITHRCIEAKVRLPLLVSICLHTSEGEHGEEREDTEDGAKGFHQGPGAIRTSGAMIT
jgi:hypothetical protein